MIIIVIKTVACICMLLSVIFSCFILLHLVHISEYQMSVLYVYYTLNHPITNIISSDLEGV